VYYHRIDRSLQEGGVKKNLTRHHLIPTSRLYVKGKKKQDKDNIVHLPDDFHAYWHNLVGNMTTEEALTFFSEVMQPNTKWTSKRLAMLRREIKRCSRGLK